MSDPKQPRKESRTEIDDLQACLKRFGHRIAIMNAQQEINMPLTEVNDWFAALNAFIQTTPSRTDETTTGTNRSHP
jgi:hypothetical protein